jgi:putative sterol carrier protein
MEAKFFLENLRDRVQPESLVGEDSKIAFDLAGERGGQFTMIIRETRIWIEDGLHDDAPCGLKSEYDTFLRIVNKEENVMMALMMGRLRIKNQGEMIKYARILGFM